MRQFVEPQRNRLNFRHKYNCVKTKRLTRTESVKLLKSTKVRWGQTLNKNIVGKISGADPSALSPTLSKNRNGLITERKESSWSQLIEDSWVAKSHFSIWQQPNFENWFYYPVSVYHSNLNDIQLSRVISQLYIQPFHYKMIFFMIYSWMIRRSVIIKI